ncbi:kinase domain protein [Burkholderia ambifaria AMMD]|nr:kinase domain protein [Burkholderia ambifaria AMMD]
MNNVWSGQLTWKLAGWQATGEKKGGGQGEAWPVARTGDVAFLKVLKSQNDPERRARMYREAVALSTYKHPGIPFLIWTRLAAARRGCPRH